MELERKRVLFKFDSSQAIAFDQLESLKQTHYAAFTLIVKQNYSLEVKVDPTNFIQRLTLKMTKPFEKDALCAKKNWLVQINDRIAR